LPLLLADDVALLAGSLILEPLVFFFSAFDSLSSSAALPSAGGGPLKFDK
jgi:hypothetical protein